jgi:N4-(beta-N-acetylglucosaminyl)-L-asparaginase
MFPKRNFLFLFLSPLIGFFSKPPRDATDLQIVINTWAFTDATEASWSALSSLGPIEAVIAGGNTCERLQCDYTVGYGGSPAEDNAVSLDALLIDGASLEAGGVVNLRSTPHAIKAAHLVMQHTHHTILAGSQADSFAASMGLPPHDLNTDHSRQIYQDWLDNKCQPNFWHNVLPDPSTSCGPYIPAVPAVQQHNHNSTNNHTTSQWVSATAHDTIALAAISIINSNNKDPSSLSATVSMAAGCSSNGATHKIPGRVSDCGVPGAGAYADAAVGACGSTGDGDAHLRFLPCYQVVENMRRGMLPKEAAEDAIGRIARKVPGYVGAVFAVDVRGRHAGACFGWEFKYSYKTKFSDTVQVVTVQPILL